MSTLPRDVQTSVTPTSNVLTACRLLSTTASHWCPSPRTWTVSVQRVGLVLQYSTVLMYVHLFLVLVLTETVPEKALRYLILVLMYVNLLLVLIRTRTVSVQRLRAVLLSPQWTKWIRSVTQRACTTTRTRGAGHGISCAALETISSYHKEMWGTRGEP